MSILDNLNNLAITTTKAAMANIVGGGLNYLHSRAANGGRDRGCKFYYNAGAGGSILQVAAKSVVGGFVPALKDEAMNVFNSLLDRKKGKNQVVGERWVESELERQEKEVKQYGKMKVEEGTVLALDDWGNICPDALMLGIELDQPIGLIGVADAGLGGETSDFSDRTVQQVINTRTLVWYDVTALINVSSDKNLISTKVVGRDYSRKELISNGDIKFSVSGQITSKYPDIYPTEEVQKFLRVMQYKGIVKVNNMLLDQFGIDHIVITDFNLSSKEGYKAVQNYTFTALGLQPEKTMKLTSDTIEEKLPETTTNTSESGTWVDIFNEKLDGLKSAASDITEQGLAISTGLLEKLL